MINENVIVTFTGTYQEVSIGSYPTEGQIYHRSGVPGASERSLPHSHHWKLEMDKIISWSVY